MEHSVRDFLLEFKLVASKSGVYLIRRHDTNATLAYLGLTKKNVEELILSLAVQNYSEGPLPDDKGLAGDLWVFGCEANGQEIYLKLKLADIGGKKIAKCISCHIPKYEMKYPLKN